MADTLQGTVTFYSQTRGFGLIQTDGSKTKVFVHFSDVQATSRPLAEGDRVQFTIRDSRKGPMAADVVRINQA